MLYAHVAGTCRSQNNQMLLELGLQVRKPPAWVLGTECSPSARVVHTLNLKAVSSAQLAHSYHQKEKSQDLYVCHRKRHTSLARHSGSLEMWERAWQTNGIRK